MTRRISYKIVAVTMALVIFTMSIFTVQKKEVKGAAIPVIGAVLTAVGVAVAVYIAAENNEEYEDWYEYTWRPKRQQAYEELLNANGLVPKSSAFAEYLLAFPDPWQEVRIWLANHTNKPVENVTEDECKQALYNMFKDCTINENSDTFTMSNDLRSYINFIGEDFKNSTGYKYYYSYSIQDNINLFPTGDVYQALLQFLTNRDYDLVILSTLDNVNPCLFAFNTDNAGYVLYQYANNNNIYAKLFDNNTWEAIRYSNDTCDLYLYDNQTRYFLKTDNSYDYAGANINLSINKGNTFAGYGYNAVISTNGYRTYKVYNTLNDFKNGIVGVAPYYESQIWKDFAGSSGTYTIDSNNINKITYGDVTNYINTYNNENGSNPSTNDIQIFIDTNESGSNGGQGGEGGQGGQGGQGGTGGSANVTNNNNPVFNNNPNININLGIPSLSDNTVSGNGTGSGGVGDIFGFLSQIGEVIGSLVKNIGKVLADILEGIVSVVTDLLESIPTVFGDFMGALIGWLPEELQSLILLSITAMIIVGLIKLFRG